MFRVFWFREFNFRSKGQNFQGLMFHYQEFMFRIKICGTNAPGFCEVSEEQMKELISVKTNDPSIEEMLEDGEDEENEKDESDGEEPQCQVTTRQLSVFLGSFENLCEQLMDIDECVDKMEKMIGLLEQIKQEYLEKYSEMIKKLVNKQSRIPSLFH